MDEGCYHHETHSNLLAEGRCIGFSWNRDSWRADHDCHLGKNPGGNLGTAQANPCCWLTPIGSQLANCQAPCIILWDTASLLLMCSQQSKSADSVARSIGEHWREGHYAYTCACATSGKLPIEEEKDESCTSNACLVTGMDTCAGLSLHFAKLALLEVPDFAPSMLAKVAAQHRRSPAGFLVVSARWVTVGAYRWHLGHCNKQTAQVTSWIFGAAGATSAFCASSLNKIASKPTNR